MYKCGCAFADQRAKSKNYTRRSLLMAELYMQIIILKKKREGRGGGASPKMSKASYLPGSTFGTWGIFNF